MRLSTIWTVESMSTMERLRRTRVWAVLQIARKLPQTIKYAVVLQDLDERRMDNLGTSTLEKVLNERFNK